MLMLFISHVVPVKFYHSFQTQNVSQAVVVHGKPILSISKPSAIDVNVIIRNI